MATPDMDVIKEIPGYKVILKAVLKSQIQQLVEQLASHTDEESVILTASVSDGTLSHLGSESGKNFLDDHEDIKSQFLGFCLKRHHRKKVQQQQTSPMKSQPWPTHLGQGPGPRPRTVNRPTFPRQNAPRHPLPVPSSLVKNVRHEPYPVSKPQRRSVDSTLDIARPASDVSGETKTIVKVEPDDSSQHSGSGGESSLIQGDNSIPNEGQGNEDQTLDSIARNDSSSDSNNASDPQTSAGGDVDPNVNIKVEAISESDMELEITGVELGNNSDSIGSQKDMWSPNTSQGYDPSGAMGSPGDLQPNYSGHTKTEPRSHASIEEELEPGDGSVLDVSLTGLAATTLSCETCNATFKRKDNLKRHMKKHSADFKHHCSYCNIYFKTTEQLLQHKSAKHGSQHLCSTCGKQFTTNQGLKRHASIAHRAAGSPSTCLHSCPFSGCGAKFVTRSKFVDHMNRHTGSKPYSCKGCGKKYADRYKMTLHEDMCTGKKSVYCSHCSLPFNSKTAMKMHIKTKHLLQSYQCECGQVFAHKSGLSRHKGKNH